MCVCLLFIYVFFFPFYVLYVFVYTFMSVFVSVCFFVYVCVYACVFYVFGNGCVHIGASAFMLAWATHKTVMMHQRFRCVVSPWEWKAKLVDMQSAFPTMQMCCKIAEVFHYTNLSPLSRFLFSFCILSLVFFSCLLYESPCTERGEGKSVGEGES